MENFWLRLTNFLSFTGIKDKTVWQDTLFIPFAFYILKSIYDYFNYHKPLNLLFKSFISSKLSTFIFLSQLKALDDNGNIDQDPKYEIHYPTPLPQNKNNLSKAGRLRIDPVWSEGDGECLGDVYNTLGVAGKTSKIQIADTIKDWSKYNNPIITIGFNPKTKELKGKCSPIHYRSVTRSIKTNMGIIPTPCLTIKKSKDILDSIIPNDAGIIQKTFIKDSGTPVFILAGLGTTGTSASGYILSKNAVALGKLYGDDPFCVLIHVDSFGGRTTANIKALYPNPSFLNKLLHLPTFLYYRSKKLFN